MTEINPYSLSSFYCECYFKETRLSNATCFLTRRGSQFYLVTNWHVVTGRHPDTGECLSNMCAVPDSLHVYYPTKQDNGYRLDVCSRIPLVDSEGKHIWKEIKIGQRFIDVVVIPVNLDFCFSSICIESAEEPFNDVVCTEITSPLYILGFPFGREFGYLPIWKKSTIASEPQYELEPDFPYFFVDTASRPGMSGSPVILFEKRPVIITNEKENKLSSHFTKLIGIYSGRIGVTDGGDAQLGKVWKADIIDKLIVCD